MAWSSRLGVGVIAFASGGAITALVVKAASPDTGRTRGTFAVPHPEFFHSSEKSTLTGDFSNEIPPYKVWEKDWDRRELGPAERRKSLRRGIAEDLVKKVGREGTAAPTANRHLLFIRHGQFNRKGKKDEERGLTVLGREQAELTGQRLKALGIPVTVLVGSSMTRAKETADIIASFFPGLPRNQTDLLMEGAPILPVPPTRNWKPPQLQYYSDGARIEAAFRSFVHRANPEQETDSYELYVCHGNVIRYIVCRALQFPPEGWIRLSLYHGSITWLTILPDGRVVLQCLGDRMAGFSRLGVGMIAFTSGGAVAALVMNVWSPAQDGGCAENQFLAPDSKFFRLPERQPIGTDVLSHVTPPPTVWDENWDRRDPSTIEKKKLKRSRTEGDLAKKAELEQKVVPTANRHLLFIRHGQYDMKGKEDEDRRLTPLGRMQAELTGQRLRALGIPITVLVGSSMTRAKETADIIASFFPDVPRSQTDLLREGAPVMPDPSVGHWKPERFVRISRWSSPWWFVHLGDGYSRSVMDNGRACFFSLVFQQFYSDGARIEAAFRSYVHRAPPEQSTDTYEVFVCHANVIRYIVCRALQFPPEGWLRMGLNHGSITWLTIRPSGRVVLRSLGDAGYMPPDKVTCNGSK
ncbi:unnamed protein product [Darwinula stevensoni]|uniref:Serine/threonine-protein phosphatase PGAM5, mitochondrial n=1 Tax=Darwinula stevensoni TaxID=69355 RepID=A0A7R9A7N7_9CRUS|nr:unnamed protein product [Darwinula stevensoni]CAG0892751.1 unnamed protein product [Darwinula stevensoni]